jgi:hypothetical protein
MDATDTVLNVISSKGDESGLSLTGSQTYGDATVKTVISGLSFDISSGADTDITLNFLGTTNSGVLKWMEDEDYFKFADNVNLDTLTASKVVFTDANKTLTSTGIGTSAQFIKGDGSLDSSVYLTTGYVDRGDPSASDFTLASLTTNGAWQDLDLSAIVPAGAVSVHMTVQIRDDATDSWVSFRKNGNSNAINAANIPTQVANLNLENELIVTLDANRVIEYSAKNTTFTAISIKIRGWFL